MTVFVDIANRKNAKKDTNKRIRESGSFGVIEIYDSFNLNYTHTEADPF
jgi:hypothetical protein